MKFENSAEEIYESEKELIIADIFEYNNYRNDSSKLSYCFVHLYDIINLFLPFSFVLIIKFD